MAKKYPFQDLSIIRIILHRMGQLVQFFLNDESVIFDGTLEPSMPCTYKIFYHLFSFMKLRYDVEQLMLNDLEYLGIWIVEIFYIIPYSNFLEIPDIVNTCT